MIHQLQEIQNILQQNAHLFTSASLPTQWHVEAYRSQPHEAEAYEYFSLPAIFVDYQMTGQGKNKPRIITITLHILTDTMASEHFSTQWGEKRFHTLGILQHIFEGATLGNTTPLRFISETPIDAEIIHYHTQTYEFEAHLCDLFTSLSHPAQYQVGYFDTVTLQAELHQPFASKIGKTK